MTDRTRRAVFLDRDGVLNEAVIVNGIPRPPAGARELRMHRDAPSAVALLKVAGFVVVCVTNQPDVARGTQSREAVDAMNASLQEQLQLDDILVCCHDDDDHCDCRKPMPGLLLRAADKHHIDLPASFMIGDRWRDVEAGRRAGCKTIWINCGYKEDCLVAAPDRTVESLMGAIHYILKPTQE